jgi:hypothetical protein
MGIAVFELSSEFVINLIFRCFCSGCSVYPNKFEVTVYVRLPGRPQCPQVITSDQS